MFKTGWGILAILLSLLLLTSVALLLGNCYSQQYYRMPLRETLILALERSNIDWLGLKQWLQPAPQFADHAFDGRLRSQHPRILLPELSTWNGQGIPPLIVQRNILYQRLGIAAPPTCNSHDLLSQVVCWISTGDPRQAEESLDTLTYFPITVEKPESVGSYGNIWELAIAYDFLSLHPGMSGDTRKKIENNIEYALQKTLELLDRSSASLWHGRSTLAAIAWLCAITLSPQDDSAKDLLRRAQAHFLDVIKALEITESWPEGYNYWIQNRGFLLALAASAYLNGLEDSRQAEWIRKIMGRIGYWHIYATRPDNRIENLGDESSRVDLKDETRRVIDILAQLTQDPVLATYSLYLERLHGDESYYRDYRWGFRLFNNPTIPILATKQQLKTLERFNNILPTTELFGHDGPNLVYIRSGWSAEDTFISFKAGHIFTHHGHYDAGHFSIFKGMPLATNSSSYANFLSPNRLYYGIRTIAKNSLLVLRPDEVVKPTHTIELNVVDGGQRVVLPTGSAIQNTQHWRTNLEKGIFLKGGTLKHFEHRQQKYSYVAADLTAAYNTPWHDEGGTGGKVLSVVRQLLYLPVEDRLIVCDQVQTVEANYVKKWLLHTVQKPQINGLKALKGDITNGILESVASEAFIQNGRGRLVLQRIFPEDAVLRLVGGKDYQYYVETDGDDSILNGHNYVEGSAYQSWFDTSEWRIEIQPILPKLADTFLIVLTPSLDSPRYTPITALAVQEPDHGIVTDQSVILFIDARSQGILKFSLPKSLPLYIVGLPEITKVTVQQNAAIVNTQTSDQGVAIFAANQLTAGPITLTWQ